MYFKIFKILVLILYFTKVTRAKVCTEYKTCGECIGNPNNCIWCLKENYNGTRCQPKTLLQNWKLCDTFYDPSSKHPANLIITKDDPLSGDGNINEFIQFQPQSLTIKARPGDTVEFEMFYKPAKDYPLDVYFLSDNSYTMEFQREKLHNQAEEIYIALSKITNNVQFGMGTYIEKPGFPYAFSGEVYSFRHHLNITKNIRDLIKVLWETVPIGNCDTPENALDGLMQAIVCEKEVGWRKDARRIIVLSTDSPYHSAGDGKMVGAVKPNDMKCHLTNDIYEKDSLIYDYPSVNQINQVASEKRVTILFAALESMKKVYEGLVQKISGSEYVVLSKGSNISNIIENLYKSQVQNLTLSKKNLPQHVKLVLDPPCSVENPKGFKVGETVTIKAKLTINECPKDGKITQFSIGPSKLKDVLDIHLEVVCSCDCEKESVGENNSDKCNLSGTRQCGVCKCNNERYGEACECDGDSTEELDLKICGKKNDRPACSGHGVCRCGACKCEQNFFGSYCENSRTECPFHDNKPCGSHGRCFSNGTCNCNEGWSGLACNCNDMACIGPSSQTCSGHGKCNCGVCECFTDKANNKKYLGTYCNICEGCGEERCAELGEFVECYHQKRDLKKCDENETKYTSDLYNVRVSKKTEFNSTTISGFYRCRRIMENGSFIFFKFNDTDDNTLIVIQEETELPPEPNKWVAFYSALGIILLIGILTGIVWKLLIDYYDKVEYEKFLNQCNAEGFDVPEVDNNPIYQPPSTTISNPAYKG